MRKKIWRESDQESEYGRYRRRVRIHRCHLVGYAVAALGALLGMIVFWR